MLLTNELKTDRHIDVKSKKIENKIKFKGNFNFGKFKKKRQHNIIKENIFTILKPGKANRTKNKKQ